MNLSALDSRLGELLRKANVGPEVDDAEYLGAAMGLTSELARYAITQARDATHTPRKLYC